MKKLLSTLAYGAIACVTTTALAAPACGDGINNLKTWDGGGADNNWNTPGNWSPDGVPDCDDDVRFDATSIKYCYITSSIQVRDMSTLGNWKGRIFVRGTSSMQLRNLLMQGGFIAAGDTNGLFVANDVTMTENSFLSVKTGLITGSLTMSNCVFAVRDRGYLDVLNMTMNKFSQYTAPDGFQQGGPSTAGITYIRGNFSKVKISSFQHEKGLVRFCGATNGTINTNNSIVNMWNIEIDKKADGSGNTTTPAHLYTKSGSNDVIYAENRLSLIEATLTGWTMNDWVAGNDSVVVDPSMANNLSSHYFSNAGHATLAFLGGNNGSLYHNTLLTGTYNVRVEKDSVNDIVTVRGIQEIGSMVESIHIVKGKLTFDGSGSARLNASTGSGLHVLDGGQMLAPYDDTLFFAGCWDMANSTCFNAQNGILVLDGTGSKTTFSQNDDTIYVNDLLITGTNGGSQAVYNWISHFDVLYVKGDIKITSPDAYLSNLQLFLEGDFLSGQTTANSGLKYTYMMAFVGGNTQSVTLTSASIDAYKHGVAFDKTAGVVNLNSNMDIKAIYLNYGVFNVGSYLVNILQPDKIFGGNVNSYINGPVTVAHGGFTWPGNVKIPVGKGSSYGPINLRNGTTGNTYTVEYFNTGYSGTDTVNDPLDAVSSSEYWKVDRVAGATAYQVSLPTTNAPGGWSAAQIRVAGNDGSGWNNLGPAGGASGGLVTSTTGTTSSTRYFTLGVDNAASVITLHEGVSGKEVQTEKSVRANRQDERLNSGQMSVFPNPAQKRFAINMDNAASGVLSITDLNGRIMFAGNAQSTQWIDCSSWSSGIYLVRFTDGMHSITRRISVSY